MIIAFSGKAGAGKDTCYGLTQRLFLKRLQVPTLPSDKEILDNEVKAWTGWTKELFASKLKEFVASGIGCKVTDLDKQDFKISTLPECWNLVGEGPMTVREMLIRVGEGMRNVVHPDIWVNFLFEKYKTRRRKNEEEEYNDVYPDWLITDVRYPNEVTRIQESGGIVIRVVSPNERIIDSPSETSLDGWPFKFVVTNDGDLAHLESQIEKILQEINL